MLKRYLTTLIAGAVLTLTPIPGLSQHSGMGGGSGMGAGGSMPGGPGPRMGSPNGMGAGMDQSGGMSGVSEQRRMRAKALQRNHRDLLDFDPHGNLIVRNEFVGVGATTQGLANAQAAGFVITRQDALKGLDADIVVVTAPRGMSARKALKKLRELDPGATYDFNHIYFESSAGAGTDDAAATAPAPVSRSAADGRALSVRVGLIDGGVEPSHSALRSLTLHIQGFSGSAAPSAHGTAVASRLVAGFDGVAPTMPNVDLYVADVYCGAPTGGSTDAVIHALAWLVQENVPVINVSLVGPPNSLLQRVVEMASARGHLLVAAVGNDGPSAPPLYPAAYPGVVAVTGVDRARKVLIEAGRGKFVAFAAPGADIEAASLPNGYSPVRGTSYAAPIVASRLSLLLERPDRVAAERAVSGLAASAVHLGSSGRDPVYGYGCVGCAAPNAAVGAARPH